MNHSPLSIRENVDLAPLNTMHIHATARYFAEIKTKQELKKLLQNSQWKGIPIFILGGGSNVLFVGDFEGLVIYISIKGREVIKQDADRIKLTVGAGENWHQLVRYCVEKGWGGIENLSLIPGTTGAAPIQNIGAYGVELKDVFESLTAVKIKTADEQTFSNKDCRFGYRDSVFKNGLKNQFVVTDVTLNLHKHPELHTEYGAIQNELERKDISEPTIEDISDIVIRIRNRKLPNPNELANAGSFFKNPIIDNAEFEALKKQYPSIPGYPVDDERTKVPAGWLIEQAGWKGKTAGNVGTYRQQALVIINKGGAGGQEILAFSQRIQQSVRENFGIDLAQEVNIVPNRMVQSNYI